MYSTLYDCMQLYPTFQINPALQIICGYGAAGVFDTDEALCGYGVTMYVRVISAVVAIFEVQT